MSEKSDYVSKRFAETGEAPEWVCSYTLGAKDERLELSLYNKNAKVKAKAMLGYESVKGLIESLQNYIASIDRLDGVSEW